MINNKSEHTIEIITHHDEETETKDERIEKKTTSLKDLVIDAVCSEGFLLLLGLTAIALDPLFFYVPVIKHSSTCLGFDKTLIIVAVILRTSVDILHDWSWWSKSRAPENRAKGAAVGKWDISADGLRQLLKWLPNDRKLPSSAGRPENYKTSSPGGRSSATARVTIINLLTCFKISRILSLNGRSSLEARVTAIIASVPLPQVVILAVGLHSHLKTWLKYGVICQFLPRIIRTYPTYEAATRSSDIYALIGAAFNLLLFVLASHALGGFWYLRAVERKMDCMEKTCRGHSGCIKSFLYCETSNYADNGFINDICAAHPTSNTTTPFDYGLCHDAIKSDLVGSTNFINKIANGFWWGIHNLSSMAQNLEFSDYLWDTCFATLICIIGLFLFALLIGNLQLYLQSKLPSTVAKLKEKKEDLEKWAPFTILPPHLRKEVSMCQHNRWQESSEVNIESLFNHIPWELRKKLKPYFCNNLFYKVKEFEELDKKVKKELRARARAVVFQARTNIHQEGQPIHEMIHIVHGKVSAYSHHDVKEGLHAKELKKDDSFGKELLLGALESRSPKLTLATQTIQSVTKVEAFALSLDDFATVFNKYERLLQPNAKVWAVNVFEGRYKRKLEKSTQEGKERSLNGKKNTQIIHNRS